MSLYPSRSAWQNIAGSMPSSLAHYIVPRGLDKVHTLALVLQGLAWRLPFHPQVLVFCNCRRQAVRVASLMAPLGVPVEVFLTDRDAVAVWDRLLAGDPCVVLTTEALGVGVDLPLVGAVVNYDVPFRLVKQKEFDHLKMYAHRAGRAGRRGAAGVVVTFADPWDIGAGTLESVLRLERGHGLDEWDFEWEGPRAAWASVVYRAIVHREVRVQVLQPTPKRVPWSAQSVGCL